MCITVKAVINDLHLEHIPVFMHKAYFLCFPHIFFFSDFILHTLNTRHYLGLEFATQIQTYLISSTIENTVKFTKNKRGIAHTIPRKHLGMFQLPQIHPSRGRSCFKSSVFRFFVKHDLLWISLTVHACG